MWAALIILAQLAGAPQPGGQPDLALCTGETQSEREQSIAACHRVVSNHVLDNKKVAHAYLILSRWASEPADAIPHLDQAIALDPDQAQLWGERGFQYHMLANYDRALADYEKALEIDPRNYYTLQMRAFTYQRRGEDARALADLDRAIAVDAKPPYAYTTKAEILAKQGKPSEALAVLDQGLVFNPHHSQIFQDKAKIFRERGDGDGELKALNGMLEFDPKSQLALLLRAMLYERLGKRALAIADYESILALNPSDKFSRERRDRLAAAQDGGPAVAPPKVVEPGEGKGAKKSKRGAAPELECRVYVPGAGITVSVACAK